MPGSSAQPCSEAFMIHLLPFHCFLSLVPRELCSGMDRVFLLILKYRYVSISRQASPSVGWADLMWIRKKNENMLHAFDSFLREKAATSRNASCIGSGFLMSGSTSACAQKNWLGPETIQQRLYSHCEIHHCLVPVSEQSCKPTDFSTCKPETTALTARGS